MTKVPSLSYDKVIRALRRDGWVLPEHVAHHRRLLLLQLADLLLDRAGRDEPIRDHGAVLADAVRAVDRPRTAEKPAFFGELT
jgi:hypothetical protein